MVLQIEHQQISIIANFGHLTDKTHLKDIFIFTKATMLSQMASVFTTNG
jgi:hypothetical protein